MRNLSTFDENFRRYKPMKCPKCGSTNNTPTRLKDGRDGAQCNDCGCKMVTKKKVESSNQNSEIQTSNIKETPTKQLKNEVKTEKSVTPVSAPIPDEDIQYEPNSYQALFPKISDDIFDVTGIDLSELSKKIAKKGCVIWNEFKVWIKEPFSIVALVLIVFMLGVIASLSKSKVTVSQDYLNNADILSEVESTMQNPMIVTTESTTTTTTKLPTTTTTTAKKITSYSANMYKVGTDIPAGEYVLLSVGDNGYFAISSDNSGSLYSIVANDNFQKCSYVLVSDGQYLEFSNAIAYPANEMSKFSPDFEGYLLSGMYKVGQDIAPGEYKVIADGDSGYYAIYSSAKQRLSDIVSNNNFESSKYVTLKNGQYIKLSNAKIKVE